MAGASAGPGRCATSARSAATVTITGRSSRESAGARPRSQPKQRGPRTLREKPVQRDAFERLVGEALASIPRRFKKAMQNIAIVVEDEPSRELLAEMAIEPPDTLL